MARLIESDSFWADVEAIIPVFNKIKSALLSLEKQSSDVFAVFPVVCRLRETLPPVVKDAPSSTVIVSPSPVV